MKDKDCTNFAVRITIKQYKVLKLLKAIQIFSITVEHAKKDNSYYKYYSNNEIIDILEQIQRCIHNTHYFLLEHLSIYFIDRFLETFMDSIIECCAQSDILLSQK